MVHNADLPALSGLGSSSTFTVGLVKAISALNGKMLTKKDDEYIIKLISNEVNKAFRYAEDSKFPNSDELYTQVYFGE